VWEHPGNCSLFIVNKGAQKVDKNDKKYFHSTTAKLLYLAKRARTGILTIIFFVYEGTVCKGTGQRKAREGIGVSQVVRGSSTTTLGMCGRRNCGVCRCSICDV